jgi:RNA polymerase sigma factor (sigma-70 family)
MSQATTTKSFRELMEEVRQGSQEAAWTLVDQYGPHVQRFVRRTLNRQLRPQFDSIDFVQIVWASLFRTSSKLAEFQQPEELIAFLAGMAKNKVLKEMYKRTQTARYDIGREQRVASPEEGSGAVERTPTPSAVAIAKERWDLLLANQNSTVQSVVRMRLQGVPFVEIADRLSINERTARKAIARLTGEEAEEGDQAEENA